MRAHRLRLSFLALAFAGALAACSPPQPQPEAGLPEAAAPEAAVSLEISDPWAGATPDGAKVAAGYMTIGNPGAAPDRLIGAASPRAGTTEIHEMSMENGQMQMRPVTGVDVPAGGTATLEPGGLHLMFFDLDAAFVEGETVPVTLTFENAGAVDSMLTVRKREVHGGH